MEIELRQVASGLKRRGWVILLTMLLVGALAYLLTSGQTATYSATTTLLVNPQQATGTVDNQSLLASRSQAETYVRLVESGPVLLRVNSELGLPYTQGELANKIDAQVVMNTQLIKISVKDPSAEEAARIANSVAAQFEGQVEDLTIGRLQENLTQLRAERSTLETRMTELDAELASLDENSEDQATKDQVRNLRIERTRAQETIADIDSSVRSINQQLATTTSPVEVADEAQAAREPDSPKPMLMTALGLFLGLLVGAGIAAMLEFTDKKIRPETDIEELAESRLLVTIPGPRQSSSGQPFVLASADSPAAEAVRLLRTRIASVTSAGKQSTIVFASAGGTNATADIVASLGVVIAQAGLRTVIIDADLRNPRQHTVFGIVNEGGLAGGLSVEEGQPQGVDAATVAPRLGVITAGATDASPAELVGSAAFTSLVTGIRQGADVTLISAPSAIASSDALSMALNADGVVLVAQYGATSRDDLAALAETMHQDDICLLGIVMLTK